MGDESSKQIWKKVIETMEGSLSKAQVKTWFHGSSLANLNQGVAEVYVDNKFALEAIKKFAYDRLKTTLTDISGTPIKEVVLTEKTARFEEPTTNTNSLFENPNHQTTATAPVTNVELTQPSPESNLNHKYTFNKFIVGNRNRLAFAAAQGVSEKPGNMYNPLYLYGGVGLGKTHLMQAIGNAVIAREPQKRVLYVSCEHFMNEFVQCLKTGKIDGFKKKYRTIDVFLIDDIQFISGKEGTQEEFFHTFNALYETSRQIVITSDKAPSEIKGLEERLSSRFYAGLIADIQPPDLETRQAILFSKCQEKNIVLPNEVILYIAEEVETNIRELEGALTTVVGHLMSENILKPTNKDIREALNKRGHINKPAKKTRLEQVLEVVSEYYQIDLIDIKGACRQKEFVKPRQVLMYLMKHDVGMTYPAIGKEIGGRDHTTVMYAVDKIEKEMKKSPEMLGELESIKEMYYARLK